MLAKIAIIVGSVRQNRQGIKGRPLDGRKNENSRAYCLFY